jgi:hypothetical protein
MGFKIKMPPGFIFQVTDHLNDKPWRVPIQFLNHKTGNNTFWLPLMALEQLMISKEEMLAHIQLLPISSTLLTMKGTHHIVYPRLLAITHFIFLEADTVSFPYMDEENLAGT